MSMINFHCPLVPDLRAPKRLQHPVNHVEETSKACEESWHAKASMENPLESKGSLRQHCGLPSGANTILLIYEVLNSHSYFLFPSNSFEHDCEIRFY